MKQRLEKLLSENQESETARETYILSTVELFMAKLKLEETKQEFRISVEERRLAELQRAEEAEFSSVEIAEMRDTMID
ncbi:hypothetical protein Bca52824_089862 [Brassica carinata]|uniref:Uncharacterized protein n=1 Tax=Brassica carinata TaxID=52824 RepID=A0A8X7NTX3_BRACI|nr:hypothetical protein Bca52824_089862 [Brassica carinata]